MSLLRDILKKPKDGSANNKRDTASLKSSGARSLVDSLYSLAIGGQRVKKRRKPDFSDLAPEWFHDDPPEPSDMPGTVARKAGEFCAWTTAHATVVPLRLEEEHHWLSLVLFSHASESSMAAMYHNEARVAGEVRLCLKKTKSISSIDVWLAAIAPAGQIISFTANVWNRQKGNPLRPDQKPELFKDKFPLGTYVFPFELPPLPKFVPVTHPDNDTRKKKGLVALPPSGAIDFTCGVGVRRDSFGGINEDFDMVLQYIPLMRPLPRVRTPFPFLASREDWPFKRESIGGWILSPFGGRGRIGTEIVEIEGILGVQDPAVYNAGHVLEFGVLLWSKSAEAMKLLAQPAAVSAGYYKADFLPSSEALRPREQSRQTRTMQRMTEGRVWVTDEGRPKEGEPVPELVSLDLPGSGVPSSPSAPASPLKMKRAISSRMQSVWTAEEDEDGADPVVDGDGHAKEPSSPRHSIEDNLDGQGTDHFQRLDGELRVPACRPVSYRYTNIGREYSLQLHITHPQYAHISPTGPGLLAEVPIWYVSDRPLNGGPASLNQDPAYLAALPLKGAAISAGADAIRWPKVIGERAAQGRGGKPKLGQTFFGLVPPLKDAS